jgi:hypothetical protein
LGATIAQKVRRNKLGHPRFRLEGAAGKASRSGAQKGKPRRAVRMIWALTGAGASI